MTSHLTGMFYRTIRLFENGIKPVFVFDGAGTACVRRRVLSVRRRLGRLGGTHRRHHFNGPRHPPTSRARARGQRRP